jgi:hypothetical protein
MQYAAILQLLAVAIPGIIAFSGKIITGKKRFIIAIAAYFILRKWTTDAAKSKSESEIQSGLGYTNANALAGLYKAALNPSGVEFLMGTDGTDESLIYELAAKTKSYKAVYDAYKIQFKRDLTVDLKSELGTDEYKRFIDILG